MAFTTRSKRETDVALKSTPESVGPGAYVKGSTRKTRAANAPFNSSVPREPVVVVGEDFKTPGPGAYQVKETVSHNAVSATAMVAKSSRFDDKTKPIPGPGSYQVESKWVKDDHTKYYPNAGRRINWVRVATAPSIPNSNQSYGYDETPTGELVLHRPPSRDATKGPAYYAPDDRAVRPTRAVDFSKSKVNRSAFNPAPNPGPGQYEPPAIKKHEDFSTKPSSNFASKVERQSVVKKTQLATPGPGSYEVPSGFKKPHVPEENQFFGSTVDRSVIPSTFSRTAPAGLNTPGPGAYEEIRTRFRSEKPGALADHGPFSSTVSRFKEEPHQKLGPGAYNSHLINSVGKIRRNPHVKGGFGAVEERFTHDHTVIEPTTDTVGPGSYEVEKKPRRRVKPSSVFKSGTERTSFSKGKEEIPAPGAYELQQEWVKTMRSYSGHPGFMAASKRFDDKHLRISDPGPGAYDPKSPEKTHLGSDKVMKSTSPRFRQATKMNVPGPGAYNQEDPRNALVKRSYNISVYDN
eukprot:TRINITY_DN5929_c0_g1_i1.p1 TRINITY_DN5929_c0_g1~~TRINITY_DN5929_c0_g1_i1.p1  ORF type:complete len:520 (-),score=93.32 TRINITY_DN5929_c0_g1_i1:1169-2728(-)